MVALRAERARLLGYASYRRLPARRSDGEDARARCATCSARSGRGRVKRALADRDALQALVQAEGGNFRIAPWDWRYYAEKLRKRLHDVDEAATKPYLQLDRIIEAAFDTATRLFGLSLRGAEGHPGLASRRAGLGRHRRRPAAMSALFFGDYFARPSKHSGAWMTSLARAGEAARRCPPADRQRDEFRQGRRRRGRRCCPSTTRARCSMNSATACTASCRT